MFIFMHVNYSYHHHSIVLSDPKLLHSEGGGVTQKFMSGFVQSLHRWP